MHLTADQVISFLEIPPVYILAQMQNELCMVIHYKIACVS